MRLRALGRTSSCNAFYAHRWVSDYAPNELLDKYSDADINDDEDLEEDDEVSRLRERLAQVERERELLQRYHLQCQGVISPLRRMPPEVLAEIFCWGGAEVGWESLPRRCHRGGRRPGAAGASVARGRCAGRRASLDDGEVAWVASWAEPGAGGEADTECTCGSGGRRSAAEYQRVRRRSEQAWTQSARSRRHGRSVKLGSHDLDADSDADTDSVADGEAEVEEWEAQMVEKVELRRVGSVAARAVYVQARPAGASCSSISLPRASVCPAAVRRVREGEPHAHPLRVLRLAVPRPLYEGTAGVGGGRVGRAVGSVLARGASTKSSEADATSEQEGLALHLLFGPRVERRTLEKVLRTLGSGLAEVVPLAPPPSTTAAVNGKESPDAKGKDRKAPPSAWPARGRSGRVAEETDTQPVRAVKPVRGVALLELYKIVGAVLPSYAALRTLLLTRPQGQQANTTFPGHRALRCVRHPHRRRVHHLHLGCGYHPRLCMPHLRPPLPRDAAELALTWPSRSRAVSLVRRIISDARSSSASCCEEELADAEGEDEDVGSVSRRGGWARKLSVCAGHLLSRPTRARAAQHRRPESARASMGRIRGHPAPIRQTLRALRRISLASIRNLRTYDEQIAALLSKQHARLYRKEGPGKLYLNARVPDDAIYNLRTNQLGPAGFKGVAKLDAKVGHTNSITRRCCEYEACDRGQTTVWAWTYDVPRRYLAERLVHLELARAGARKVTRRCPGCGVYHREFVAFFSVRSLAHVDRIVRKVLGWLGLSRVRRAHFGVAELIGFGAAEIAAETFVFSCCSGVRETAGSGLAELAAQTASFSLKQRFRPGVHPS
ncbi:hypothetical protein C8R47DRAFT_1072162 [Mycena vitilis]|nr:hypothetical protein C8R47DRAFT_1072162 [Mycena vitilis]